MNRPRLTGTNTTDATGTTTPGRMVGASGKACQAVVMRPEDRVGFTDKMLYTAQSIETSRLTHNQYDFSKFITPI
jgi:hypothetical protein